MPPAAPVTAEIKIEIIVFNPKQKLPLNIMPVIPNTVVYSIPPKAPHIQPRETALFARKNPDNKTERIVIIKTDLYAKLSPKVVRVIINARITKDIKVNDIE